MYKFKLLRVLSVLLFFYVFMSGGKQLYASESVPQIFLVQNSGWMLPFYEDPDSRLIALVEEIAERTRNYGAEKQFIAGFNQSVGENRSPKLFYSGSDPDKIRQAVKSITPARKPGKLSYADTDFREAVVGAITDFSPGQPCLLWIVTNNKNSPDNSPETVEKNKDFYRFLQDSPEIKRIVAYPYSNRVKSSSQPDYQANGLMIYGLAYGEQADRLLQEMLSQNIPFGGQPARLKPLNAEALTFIPKGVIENSNVKASLSDQKTLLLSFDAASRPETAEIVGQFRNDFFPYDINSAVIGMRTEFQGGRGGISSSISAGTISGVPAGGLSPDIHVRISIPPLPSVWSPDVIFGSGYRSKGIIYFELGSQQLEISKSFIASMSELFPKDPLPDLFFPGESAKSSTTAQPVIIQVVYPAWPLVAAGVAMLLILGLMICGWLILRREKVFRVSVDGVQKPYALRPFKEAVLRNSMGERVGVLKRGLGKAVPVMDKGKNCNINVL